MLVASLVSIFTMTLFVLKYFFLVVTQLTMVENRTFLLVQCLLLDYFLKILLQIGDWLYACVAMERLITIMKRANFNKNLSRQVAKYIILLVCIIVAGTPFLLNKCTSIITVLHFSSPFAIDIISAFGIILLLIKLRSEF